MKKLIGFSILALFVFTLILGCSGGGGADKYADVKAVLGQAVTAQDNFCAAAIKAKNPKEVVAAIDAFAKEMLAIQPKLKGLDSKYPELQKKDAKVPAELSTLLAKLETSGNQLKEAMSKVSEKYPGNTAIRDAFIRFAQAAGGSK